MKLQRRRPDEPPIEIRVTVPAEVATELRAYCRFYETTYGEPIELQGVTLEILRHFLGAERAFRRWLREQAGDEGPRA